MEVYIEKIVYGGYGLARNNDKIIFVNNVLPKEKADIKVVKIKNKVLFAEPVEITEKSNYRQDPVCDYFGLCGGCQLQHIKYSFQLKIKKEIFIESLDRIGKIKADFPVKIIPSLTPYHYRNSANIKIKNSTLGFYKRESHELVAIKNCKLFHPMLSSAFNKLNPAQIKRNGEMKITVNGNGKRYENVLNYVFRVSADSFFQINTFLINNMVEIVLKESSKFYKFADLYSGIGLFSILLSGNGKKGIGVEIAESSFKDALFNLKHNNINEKYLKFYNYNVENSVKIIERFKPEIVIIDPPRNGIEKNFCQKILDFDFIKRIVYISCNPTTLARDLKVMTKKFRIERSYLIDMFPQTHHIESIVVLKNKM